MESPQKKTNERSRARKVIYALAIWLVLGLTVRFVIGALAAGPANEHFQRTWGRTDEPVQSGLVDRTWMWDRPASPTR